MAEVYKARDNKAAALYQQCQTKNVDLLLLVACKGIATVRWGRNFPAPWCKWKWTFIYFRYKHKKTIILWDQNTSLNFSPP